MRVRSRAVLFVVGVLLSLTPVARAQQTPSGPGPASFLLGGSMGSVRTLSLDAKGRTLRYAEGDGATSALSVCPGSGAFAELATGVEDDHWWKIAVAVRDVETLELRREHRFTSFEATDGPESLAPIEIECLDPDGASVAVFGRGGNASGTIVRVTGNDERRIFRSKVDGVELEGGFAFVTQGAALREVDLRTGRVRHVGTTSPGAVSIDVSPDRRHVIFSATGAGDVTKAGHFVLDVRARRIERLRTSLTGYTWVDDRTFVVFGRDELVRVFDTRLRKLAQWTGWTELDGVVRDGVVYTAGREAVVSAPVETGPMTTVRLLPSAQSFAFEVVPPRPPRPAAPQVSDATSGPGGAVKRSSAARASPVSTDEAILPVALPQEPASGARASSTASAAGAFLLAVGLAVLLMRRRRPAR